MLCDMFLKMRKYVVEQKTQKVWNFAKRNVENSLEDEKNLVLLSSEKLKGRSDRSGL